MQKKIYVAGLFDDDTASKAQVLVDFDEGVAGIEDAINAAISSANVEVLGG